MKYRAWLFCRVADGQGPDSQRTLEMQKAQLEQFCAEHDLAIAGTSMVTGKGVTELRELAHSGIEQDSFDMIVGTSASRFGRDTFEILKVLNDLAMYGKGLCMVQEGITNMPGFSLEKDGQHDDESIELGGQSL